MEQIKEFFKKMSEQGIYIPFLRDPIVKAPSVSLTLLVVSFMHVQLALLNKVAKIFDGVDVENSIQVLIITAGLYFGRAVSKGKGKAKLEEQSKKEGEV